MIPSMKVVIPESVRSGFKEAVAEIFESGMLVGHKYTHLLESEARNSLGLTNVLATKSGQGALAVSALALRDCLGLGVVIAPTNTYYATVAPFVRAGFNIVLADMNPDDFCVSLQTVTDAFKKMDGFRLCGVIVTHLGGNIPADVEQIVELAHGLGAWVLEDAAHAHGSELNETPAGTFGDVACFSLFATKVVTAGEGGLVSAVDDHLFNLISLYAREGKQSLWESEHACWGLNETISEFNAAFGYYMLKELDLFLSERKRVALRYKELLPGVLLPANADGVGKRNSWYKVYLPIEMDGAELRDRMKEHGISLAGFAYRTPLHESGLPQLLGSSMELEVASDLCARHVCLPIWPFMEDEEIVEVVSALKLELHVRR